MLPPFHFREEGSVLQDARSGPEGKLFVSAPVRVTLPEEKLLIQCAPPSTVTGPCDWSQGCHIWSEFAKGLLEISAETTYQLNSSLCPISLPSFCFPSIGVDLNSTPHKHPIRESEWEVSFPGNSTQDQVCGVCCSASHVDLTIIILHTGTRAHDTPKHSWAALTGIAE